MPAPSLRHLLASHKVSQQNIVVAIQSEALCEILGRSNGMHYTSAGLSRRYAPRNAKGGRDGTVYWRENSYSGAA
jgi:hypothetical protein